jgi:hypothetical protein
MKYMTRKSEEYQRLKSEWMIYYKNKKVVVIYFQNSNDVIDRKFPIFCVDDGGASTHYFDG